MKVKTMVGTLIFLIVLNIGVLVTIIYLNVTDRKPPIARFMDPKSKFEPPFARQFEVVDDLSPEQQQKLRKLVRSFRAEIEPLQDEIRKLEEEMFKSLIENDRANTEKVKDVMHKISDIRLKIGEQALESLQDAKSFLSEDQQRVFIRRIMSAGRGPGLDRPKPNPPMKINRPFDRK